jgi:putative chitobiose transport system substrate-binding protein
VRATAIAAAFACWVILGTGCGSAEDRSDGTITIEFWTIALGDAFADYITGMIDTYEAEHPNVHVNWVDVSGAEVSEKFLASLVGGSPPDLANLYDLPRIFEFDVLASMDELVPPVDRAKRLDVFWYGVGQYQGTAYALPWYAGVNMMWYNRELFERAGLDPDKPPTTIDEMLAFGRQIRDRTGKYGVSWRLHPSLVAPPWSLLRLDGVWPLFNEEHSRSTINTPRAHEVLQKWVDAYQDGVVPPEALASSNRDEVNWFIEGRCAMLPFTGGWITRYFDESFEAKAVPVAQPRGALGLVPSTNQVLVVPRMSPHKQEAVDFGLFVTNDVNQLEFIRRVAILPSTKAAAANAYLRREPETSEDRAHVLSAQDIPNSFVMAPPDVPGWSRMEDVLYEEFARALAGDQTVDACLRRVQRKWDHLLAFK